MEINLKEKLRILRQQKNITQEALANHIGITPQSVGKWERGEGYPDITLLPKIAFYFDITVDELLCVDQIKIEETIKEYQKQSRIYKQSGENAKNLELWEKAYSEFPNDCRVIEGLMLAINRDAIFPCPKNKAERIIALGKELLEKSTDVNQREEAVQELCFTYNSIGDKENALYYAEMGGNFYVTRADLRAHVLEGEEGVEACQNYIMSAVSMITIMATNMVHKINFSHEEIIEIYRFSNDIIKLLFSDGNVGFHSIDISSNCFLIANEYAQMHDKQNTLNELEECVKYAVISAKLTDMDYTAPLVNRLKHRESETSKNYFGNQCNIIIESLEKPDHASSKYFDFIRDDDSFKHLIAELKKYAEYESSNSCTNLSLL